MKWSHYLCIFAGSLSYPAMHYVLGQPTAESSIWNVILAIVVAIAAGVVGAIEELKREKS